MPAATPLRLFLVAGEHSGDRLGGPLIHALRSRTRHALELNGIGGEAMAEAGCPSLFPLSEIAVMGPVAILRRLPHLARRVYETVDAVIDMKPDALVILDSPEFTHAVAKRVRRKLPHLPVIDYVSPSVWAWRPGRARRMRAYVDHILAILPFEPAVHKKLGGPDCTYVGHPLIERLNWISGLKPEKLRRRLGISNTAHVIAVLPGSRVTEIDRMMPVYGATVSRLLNQASPLEIVMPAASGSEALLRNHLSQWPVEPHILSGEDDKFTAFRLADAALATSGTVTLELAVADVPMVVAYRTEMIVALFRWMLQAHSFVLPNLVLGRNAFPEFFQEETTPQNLARALLPLIDPRSATRRKQKAALGEIRKKMALGSGTPSEKAADIVHRLAASD